MLPYDVAIFDLDGTLTESGPGIINCVRYALKKMDAEVDEASLRKYVGPPLFEGFRDFAGLSDEDARRAVKLYRERYGEVGWSENSVYEGIPRLLKSLKKHGCRLFVATGKPEKYTRKILEKYGLAQYFEDVSAVTPDDEHADKARLVAKILPEKRHRACMVGDRLFDMLGAAGNHIDGIGALYGYGSLRELEEGGASRVAQSVAQLTEMLLSDEPTEKGLFVSLEGCDGCGKSTQQALLAQWLRERGWETVVTREPGGCPISEKIRSVVLDVHNEGMSDICEALLFAAARAQHVKDVIAPAVERGAVVLCDRFVDSSVAYQGFGRGLGWEMVEAVNRPAVNGYMPDVTLLFDVDPIMALKRRMSQSEPDRIERERGEFARRVYEGYQALAQKSAARFVKIDAHGSVEEVSLLARDALALRL